MKTTIDLVSMMTLLLAAVIAMAGPGTQLDWWHFSAGLKIIRELAMPMVLFTVASAIGLVISMVTARSIVAAPLLATIFGALAAFTPIKMKQLVAENPFIHDISTDFENPPPILAAAGEERSNPPEYVGTAVVRNSTLTVAESQADAFPALVQILATGDFDENVDKARTVVSAMGMTIIAETETDGVVLIEAYDKTLWFGFIDDFVVRLTPTGDGKTEIDLRSKSRVGGSDLGANAKRVAKFIEKFNAA